MKKIAIILILLLVLALRLWKAPELFVFNADEEFQANLAWTIYHHFHIIWIGVSVSYLNYYLGPGITYLNALLFHLSSGDPISLAYFSALLGTVTTASLFYITKRLFGFRTAMLATIFYGASALLVYYDKRFWNPSFVPFISIWLTYSLASAFKNTRWLIAAWILIGVAFHVHLSLMLYWLPLLTVTFLLRRKIRPFLWLIMIGSYLLVVSPLIVFDFVHNFDNLLMPLRILTTNNGSPSRLNIIGNLTSLFSTFGRVWFLRLGTNIMNAHGLNGHGWIVGNPLLSLWTIFLAITAVPKAGKILLVIVFLYILGYVFYTKPVTEFYLVGLFPLLAILIGLGLSRLPKFLAAATVAFFVSANIATLLTTSTDFGLPAKKNLIKQVNQYVADKPFYLTTGGNNYLIDGGWRYLFKAYGKLPVSSQADSLFGWIYPDEISSQRPKYKVVVTYGEVQKFAEAAQAEFISQNYRAYILPE